MSIAMGTLYGFLLVLIRTAGLAISIPTWGARQVPMRVRLGLVFVLSFAVYQAAGAPQLEVPDTLPQLIGASVAETVIGLIGGLAARFTLEAAGAAGAMVSTATGLSYGALVDPMNGAESNALSQILRFAALAAAIELGLHREAVMWLIDSIHSAPVGGTPGIEDALVRAFTQSVYCAALAVRVAFPVLGLVGASYLALGAIGRVVPQLGLQNLGFSVAVLVGGAALYALAPEAAHRVGALAAQTFWVR
ncbi:MAG: flagellar biosynthetic protein FliR [Myxococcaceae bacterium]|nr:flagellar biosynthetic protein FliR [Myxococcaceae bacterium]